MKKSILSLMLILSACLFASGQQVKKINPSGTWKFEAPYAPSEYSTGNIIITEKEKVLAASISFTGSEYKIPAEKVSFNGDTLLMKVNIEDASVAINLKAESHTKMSGVAKGPEGDIPLTLTRQVPPASK